MPGHADGVSGTSKLTRHNRSPGSRTDEFARVVSLGPEPKMATYDGIATGLPA
jgi:hypothetical protein